jgi:N-acetylmuramoyl-L-alanine amidase
MAFTFCFQFKTIAGNLIATKKDNSKISVVVIDPGHGGKDSGTSIGKVKEKDIVLNIALKLGGIIQQNHPDVNVVYTRTEDVFIPLHKRAEIANQSDADLFISIHVNAVEAKSVNGTETFVLGLHRNNENLEVAQKENAAILLEDDYRSTYEDFDPNSNESYIMFASMQEEFQNQSVMLASNIQDEFRDYAKRKDRSVKMAGFLVLRRTTMPSVLIETGFLSHTNERSFLLSQSGQTTLAKSIYRAFNNYKLEIEERSEFNVVTEDIAPVPIKREPAESKELSKVKKEPQTEKKQIETLTKKTIPTEKTTERNEVNKKLYFSVQIMALKRKLEATPENFKGEKEVFRVDSPKISRYFSGKFDTLEKANAEKDRLNPNYKNAFVVAFENNALISVKKALETR